MKEELIVVLAQKNRHIVETCHVQDETEMHKSCREGPRVDGCREKGRAAHLIRH